MKNYDEQDDGPNGGAIVWLFFSCLVVAVLCAPAIVFWLIDKFGG
jgi:hypothetical protein